MNDKDITILGFSEAGRAALALIEKLREDGEELDTLKATVAEQLPYTLEDGTDDEASPVEAVEYAGAELRTLRAQLAAEKAEHAKTWRLLDDEREHVEECESRCAAEKARAEKAEAERERNARMLMDVQGDKHVVHDEKYHEHVEMWQERAYNAERSRDELGIQLAAQSERLRLAMAVVEAVRSLPPYRANMSDLAQVRGKIAALDAVPGDALATSTKIETYTVEQIRTAFARACLDEATPFFARWPEIANAVVDALAKDHAAALDRAHEASGVVTGVPFDEPQNGVKGVE